MKKSLLMLLFFSSTVLADTSSQLIESQKKVVCLPTETIFKELSAIGEIPFWVGSGDTSRYALFYNEKSREWTLVQMNKDLACVLGAGKNHRHIVVPNS